MKIVIPFINEMWNYTNANFSNYIRYDVISKQSLLSKANPENIIMVKDMLSYIMYGQVIAYSFENYNIIEGESFTDIAFIFKLKKGLKFDPKVFSINPDIKIKNIGRWVIIEKDWSNAGKIQQQISDPANQSTGQLQEVIYIYLMPIE